MAATFWPLGVAWVQVGVMMTYSREQRRGFRRQARQEHRVDSLETELRQLVGQAVKDMTQPE